MPDFDAKYLEIEPRELVQHVLAETGQYGRAAVNVADILDLLKLEYASFDFSIGLPDEARAENTRPRALLSYPDRVVAVDSQLSDTRKRFSVLHEIAHYVLPSHEHSLYLCDDRGLGFEARLTFEQEANVFAADLLFCGDRFTLEANSSPISAATVKRLAERYQASFEATARRLVAKSVRACMLVVFRQASRIASIDPDAAPVWEKRYCIASPPFAAEYCKDLRPAVVPAEVAMQVCRQRDIAASVECEVVVNTAPGDRIVVRAEFFFNQYNIFCFVTPVDR